MAEFNIEQMESPDLLSSIFESFPWHAIHPRDREPIRESMDDIWQRFWGKPYFEQDVKGEFRPRNYSSEYHVPADE